ncbi:MAG: 3-hydroxyacyl-CoA dehydrogenase NAD-binding domain-containing protein [Variibacter sp.]
MVDMKTIGIVGSGIIGSSWALVFARASVHVRIWCREEGQEAETLARMAAMIEALRGTGLEGDDGTLARISVQTSLEEVLRDVDYVQESISEDLSQKHDILRAIEAFTPAHAIIGSSTSGIMPSRLAGALSRPERFLVVHPLTPPHLLPITELCAAPQTSDAVVSAARDFMLAVGQHPVILRSEIAGFALNRILGAMVNECFALIRDGVVSPEDVDPLITEGFGLRWGIIGPLAAMDLNAPGGIGEYLKRYGAIFDLVARSRGSEPVLNDALIAQISKNLRPHLEKKSAAERISRRDRGIAQLRAARARILGRPNQE